MPTPIDILLDPLTLTFLGLIAAIALLERFFPGRPLPHVRGWTLRSLTALFAYLMISTYLPLWGADALAPLQMFDLGTWPTWAAATVGVLVYEFGAYGYHRAMHSCTPLWRAVHQMHHSAERLDVRGAYWFSPLDMVGWTVLPSVALTVLGLSPQATTAAVLFLTFVGTFQHANLRTPVWLGYLIQRPESHSVHHARGVHRHNYADLPLVDMTFGTFRNPRRHADATGFWDGASARVVDMLLARDVSQQAET